MMLEKMAQSDFKYIFGYTAKQRGSKGCNTVHLTDKFCKASWNAQKHQSDSHYSEQVRGKLRTKGIRYENLMYVTDSVNG